MNTQQKLLFSISLLGLFFSSMLGYKFNLTPNFEYVDYWFKLIPLPIIDYGGVSTKSLPDTKIIGYAIYFLNSLFLLFKVKTDRILLPVSLIFLGLIVFAISFEANSIIQYLNKSFGGQTLYVGPFLFILNISIIKIYPKRLELKKYAL